MSVEDAEYVHAWLDSYEEAHEKARQELKSRR